MKEVISTKSAPDAIGPYSQAIRYGDLLFISGQIPLDPGTGVIVEGDIAVQTERVLKNIEAVLRASGMSFSNVLSCSCFLADMDDFSGFNQVYGKYLGESVPARETTQVAKLPKGARVEISAICGK
ncbi:MAG: RidA family protein [Rectinemataceae bacterium]